MKRNRVLFAVAAAAVASALTPGVAAASQSNACYANSACFWYGPWSGATGTGAVAGFTNGTGGSDLLPYFFGGSAAGAGTRVGNNSHSAKNTFSNELLHVHYSAGNVGPVDDFFPNQGRNFNATLVNNNRSYVFQA